MVPVLGPAPSFLAVRSIEDVQRRRSLPDRWLGLLVVLVALFLLIKGKADLISIPWLLVFTAGVVWFFIRTRRLYGWRINYFHREPVVAWFKTPAAAEQYRAHLIQTLPGVPFVHSEPTYFWWMASRV